MMERQSKLMSSGIKICFQTIRLCPQHRYASSRRESQILLARIAPFTGSPQTSCSILLDWLRPDSISNHCACLITRKKEERGHLEAVVVTCRFLKDTWEVQSHASDGWKSRKYTLSEILATRLTGRHAELRTNKSLALHSRFFLQKIEQDICFGFRSCTIHTYIRIWRQVRNLCCIAWSKRKTSLANINYIRMPFSCHQREIRVKRRQRMLDATQKYAWLSLSFCLATGKQIFLMNAHFHLNIM